MSICSGHYLNPPAPSAFTGLICTSLSTWLLLIVFVMPFSHSLYLCSWVFTDLSLVSHISLFGQLFLYPSSLLRSSCASMQVLRFFHNNYKSSHAVSYFLSILWSNFKQTIADRKQKNKRLATRHQSLTYNQS